MIAIEFRKYNFKITRKGDTPYIFDEIRKKDIILTPEEWVRQNFLHHLLYDINYPASKIAIEKEFRYNGRKKRFDILVYNNEFQPFLLIECKAQKIPLSILTATQVLQYNLEFGASYLVITNGEYTFCLDTNTKKMCKDFPSFS